ncbi:MAG: heme-dependent oxidative N-demethylase family protein, partial [Halioglobus sp.]
LTYHHHKIDQRQRYDQRVYRADARSMPAQRELAALLQDHLVNEQGDIYEQQDDTLLFKPHGMRLPVAGDEPLWHCSLWIADDLVIMEQRDDQYQLTAASLCSPSEWRLEDKFGLSIARIHDPIPGFADTLAPPVERFFHHLKVEHPVVRYNWSLQSGDGLKRRPEDNENVSIAAPVYYRCERQSLRRLPVTGAIAFTIRVYLHPLTSLPHPALTALLRSIAETPAALAAYKGFDKLAPALSRYAALAPAVH